MDLKAQDKPDILCRVFKIKLDHLIRDLKEGEIFGSIVEYFRLQSPDDKDRFISAEISYSKSNKDLYEAVQTYMVYGSYGLYNVNSPCMTHGHCTKMFPKEFRQRKIIDEVGFPKYRKRDDGRTMQKKEVHLDNSYIVPYNGKLLLKYACHLNVEYTCQTSAIKYLVKYMQKGNDRVTATIYEP
ncbi:uncharacterized protein [Arachis hypogaea]|uniref:uncharacterized protein n=1 Tax=Arachis hypogaea TaxID=3818 RepID=UPI003B211389